MARYLITKPARADLRDIVAYIRRRDPSAAASVRAKLQEEMQRLALMPMIGHPRSEARGDDVRFWRVYSYLIVYRLHTKPLQILRIVHGARDLTKALRDL